MHSNYRLATTLFHRVSTRSILLAAVLAAPVLATGSDPLIPADPAEFVGPVEASEPVYLPTLSEWWATRQDGAAPAEEPAAPAAGGGQDRVSQALDSTATQWSFQMAFQWMPNYHNDTMDNGQTRPDGAQNFAQLRIVTPIPKSDTIPFTMLPRITLRHLKNADGSSGLGQTEIFVLGIAQDWGTGRWGIGPLVNLPGSSSIGQDEWGYGLAGGAVNTSGDWFYGLLLTQAWRDENPNLPERGGAAPLGIAPFLNYQLGDGWYVGNGDMIGRWDWDASAFYLPIGVRLGKVLVGEKSSWNFYLEYQTSLIYKDWMGPAVEDSIRLNATYSLPVGI